MAPIIAFTRLQPTPPIRTFLSSETTHPVSIPEVLRERPLNIQSVQYVVTYLHPTVHTALQSNRESSCEATEREMLAKFSNSDYFLFARDDLNAGGKLCLRWRGPRRFVRPVNDFVYLIEELRN